MSSREPGAEEPMSSQPPDLARGPLAGIRVLDMATMLAGPYGATLMGDLGADVIKIESHWGDDSRHLGPERDGERSPFLSLNRSKRAIVLELKREAGRDAFARLAATSDVLEMDWDRIGELKERGVIP